MRTTIQGVKVPSLGFGTFRLGGQTCRDAVLHALHIGYRHIDTAQMYDNEEFVGQALASSGVGREDYFLTTKIGNGNHAAPNVVSSTDESLRKLGVEYVDLLLIHWPIPTVPLGETLGAMLDLQDQGKVRHIGLSNATSSIVAEAEKHARVFANQVEYHPLLGQERLRAMALEHDFMLTAYSPLAMGKVADYMVISDIAAELGFSPMAVALAWLLEQDKVVPIPKATSVDHIADNFTALDVRLSPEQIAAIDGLPKDRRLVNPSFAPDWDR
ncbi:MAG: aldo/keto reductase [Acidimicrobiia bacterium]|nr:aldo/keto reductase [Acidimicrobiia bacterium]